MQEEYLPPSIIRRFKQQIPNYIGHSNKIRNGVVIIYVSEYTPQAMSLQSIEVNGKRYNVKLIELGKLVAL